VRLGVVVLLGSLLAATLVGCSDDDDGDSSASRSTSTTALGGSLTIAAAGGEGEIEALQSLVDAFEAENDGVSVSLDAVESAGDLVTKLTTAFAGGTAPDLFLINYRRMGGFVSQIEPVTGVDTDGLYAPTTEAFSGGGQLRCLPQNASSLVVYVNPALFDQASVTLPGADWSWDDMLTTARALAAKNIEAVGFDVELIRLAPFVWSAGGEIVDDPDDPTKVTLGRAPARGAIQFFLDLQETGLDATERAAQPAEEAFAAGKVAMYLDSRRAVPGFRDASGLDFDVRPIPRGSNGRISVLHSDGYCVTKTSKSAAAARAFARYAISPEGGRILAKSGRTVPSLRALAESDAFLDPERKPASSKVWLDQLDRLRPMPNVDHWNDAEGAANGVLELLFAGKKRVDDAIREIEELTASELRPA
jgi:multiple sugar transport system substrate-binding protein